MQRVLPRPWASRCATGAQERLKAERTSIVPCTEKAIPKKEISAELEKVDVLHVFGDTGITTLTLRGVGECGACSSCSALEMHAVRPHCTGAQGPPIDKGNKGCQSWEQVKRGPTPW